MPGSYSYGGLLVRVTADTKPMAAEVSGAATKAGTEAGKTLSAKISSGLGRSARSLGKGIATALGTATIAATAFGVESFKAAAKVDTMQSALQALAKANGQSYAKMNDTIDALRKQGIEVGAAQSLVASFTKSHLNLAKATDLATVAQNASVITGKSSADTLTALNKGIQTQNVRLLRTAGVAVDVKAAQAAYAAQLGVTVKNLTSQQKAQAVLNAVLANGSKVAGAYAAAMKTPGGVLKQLPVIVDEVKVAIGQGLVKALGPAIVGVGHLATSVQEAVEPGGKLAPIFDAIGKAATNMLSPLTGVVDLTAKWLDGLDPAKVTAMAGALSKFAPEIAAVGTGLSAFAGKSLLGDLPVVGRLLGGLGGPLGVVVSTLATLALTSPAARDALAALAKTVMADLAPVMAALLPIVGQLGQALAVVLAAGLHAVLPLVPALVVVLKAALAVVLPLLPVITVLSRLLADLAPVLVPVIAAWYALSVAQTVYAAATDAARLATIAGTIAAAISTAGIWAMTAAQLAVRVATVAWTAAQWLLNAALDANPIGLVIIGLAALGAALVLAWEKSATFRDIVIAAWSAVRNAVLAAVHLITGNVSLMMRVLLAVVTGGQSELVRVVVTHWATITSTIARAWSAIVTGAEHAGADVINGLKSGMTAAISGIGGWIKKSIVDPIIDHVKSFFGIHSPSTVMAGIGENLVKGLFVGLGGVGNLVSDVFGGMPQALAGLLGKGLVSAAHLPAKALNAVMGLYGAGKKAVGWLGGALGKIGGAIGGLFSGKASAGVAQWAGTVAQVLAMLGVPQLQGLILTQMQTESGGNARAINLWDSNAKAGTPSMGLMQVIQPTFDAYAGPFRSLGIWNPMANIYAAVAYALSRYGRNIAAVLGHGHGYASGGVISEPVTGIGHRTGHAYFLGERGPEMVSPLTGPAARWPGLGSGAGTVIHVYPSAGMDERALAAMVSRELAWATAGGTR